MQLLDIQHVAIKTEDLDATNHFYGDLLGMTLTPRPPMDFPGSWFTIGSTMIHVMAGDAATGEDGSFVPGSAAVDHIALGARGFDAFKDKFVRENVAWRQFGLPEASLWQLFVKDPSGIIVELNFDSREEPAGSKGYDGTNRYEPGRF